MPASDRAPRPVHDVVAGLAALSAMAHARTRTARLWRRGRARHAGCYAGDRWSVPGAPGVPGAGLASSGVVF